MVAFGKKLAAAAAEAPFDAAHYLDYESLKALLYDLQPLHLRAPVAENALSLAVAPATNAAAMPLAPLAEGETRTRGHEVFLERMDAELRKMDAFAHERVVAVRREVRALEALDAGADVGARLQAAGDAFLEVERYVNLNVTAVRKLLKKHDKVLPERPCAAFYTARMHDMRWVRNDYSDVVVRLSRLYAARAPAAAPADGPRGVVDERSFVRATTKYWVRSDDLSAVKLAISRHLPVLVSGGRVTEGESKDSQLVNSVYLDSPSLELYHGRLAKLPGAVALRLRWYGTGEPEEVFVERKTHRDAWTGDASVKERFRVLPGDVPRLLRAEYEPPADLPAAERRLAREVQRLVSTKRLVPTVRSQCHRTAFQLAHTNAVRASIDTNLCLINEVQREDDDHAPEQGRWYRDAARSIPSSDLTRFPFAVLELKLALAEADDLPAWLRPVLASGALAPVHKFSKFVHGCAVLLPDEVQAMPYWVDDPALAPSIRATGASGASLLRRPSPPRPRAARPSSAWGDASPRGGAPLRPRAQGCGAHFADCWVAPRALADCCPGGDGDLRGVLEKPFARQKIEPKLHFANERTFVHWLHAAALLAAFGAGAGARTDGGGRATAYACGLGAGAAALAWYAALTYRWRGARIAARAPAEWGDPHGPLVLGVAVVSFLATAWCAEVRAWLARA